MLQGVAMVLNNPMMMQNAQSCKLLRIGDEKAILHIHGTDGAEVQHMVVDNKISVKAEARGLGEAGETAKDFVSKVDPKETTLAEQVAKTPRQPPPQIGGRRRIPLAHSPLLLLLLLNKHLTK
ncbi:hypothetical protein DFAR_630073 [Desulfarculales bacterium]